MFLDLVDLKLLTASNISGLEDVPNVTNFLHL